jgi:uncharacterized protein (DUF433 family)
VRLEHSIVSTLPCSRYYKCGAGAFFVQSNDAQGFPKSCQPDKITVEWRLKEKSMIDSARLVLDPAVLTGKPVIRGTRLSVDFIIGLMADGWGEADILRNYPGLSHEDLAACLAYARDVLRSEKVYPSAA